ncbi:MAG: stage 0 sporulation family protein [Chloroflexi bacterium]|nr:stage 0 sporulation family protein [Chloroflexota bacterium]
MIASIRFQPTGKVYDFDADEQLGLKPGDLVLVDTARGQQVGTVVSLRDLMEGETADGLKPVERLATGRDLALRQMLEDQEAEVLAHARGLVAKMHLKMKVVSAEYTLDRSRLTLLYASEEKRLNLDGFAAQIRRRFPGNVDLRRIGPRDHAKHLEGYGACGEPCCCSRFLEQFAPISIKMAKTQGVSLNPSEITGMCGRLRCCLDYEAKQYEDAVKEMPRRKKRVRTPFGEGKVIDLQPLRNLVVVQVEDRRVEVDADDVELV